MSLNYDRIKTRQEAGGNQWTTYSDLFMVLSVVFLLLYVATSLRTGSVSLTARSQIAASREEIQELREQLRMFEVLKEEYLQTRASMGEKKTYDELISKLDLLENEAKKEKDRLRSEATENEKRQHALNRYQLLIKNIINANLIAQSRIKNRDEIIRDKEENIKSQKKNIRTLELNITDKEQLIAKNEHAIAKIESQIKKKIKQLKIAHKSRKQTREKLQSEIQELKTESQSKIDSLRAKNEEHQQDLKSAREEIQVKNVEIKQQEETNLDLAIALQKARKAYDHKIEDLSKTHKQEARLDRQHFEETLKKQELTSAQKISRETTFRREVDKKNAAFQSRLSKLTQDFNEAQNEINQKTQALHAREKTIQEKDQTLEKTRRKVDGLSQRLQEKTKDFEKAKHEIKRKDLVLLEHEQVIQEKDQSLQTLSGELQKTNQEVSKLSRQLQDTTREYREQVASLAQELDTTRTGYNDQISKLKKEREEEARRDRQSFEQSLKNQQLTSNQRLKHEKLFREEAQRKNRLYTENISRLEQEFEDARKEIKARDNSLSKQEEDNRALALQLKNTTTSYNQQIKDLKKSNEEESKRDRALFEKNLNKEKLSAAERLTREKDFREKAEKKNQAYQGKISKLAKNFENAQEEITSKTMALQVQQETNQKLSGELEETRKKHNRQIKTLAGNLQNAKNEYGRQIHALSNDLERTKNDYNQQIDTLKEAHRSELSSDREKFEDSLKKAKFSSSQRLAKEKAFREGVEKKNQAYKNRLGKLKGAFKSARNEIDRQNSSLKEQEAANQALAGQLHKAKKAFNSKIAALGAAHEADAREARGKFESSLKQAKFNAGQRLAKEKAFREGMESKNRAYREKIGNLRNDFQKNLSNLSDKNKHLRKGLQVATKKANARRDLAQRIRQNFLKAGIRADVDLETGEVTIDFGDHYFETGDANLKAEMAEILKELVPIYAKSLFEDKRVSNKLESVEVVGFASPTYKGLFVNPGSLSDGDRSAVNYNLDLSFNRAKSIFTYVFNKRKMKFPYQKSLLPMVKVTGRSYLASDKLLNTRIPAGMSSGKYCRLYNCKKSQKVVIKFYLKDK